MAQTEEFKKLLKSVKESYGGKPVPKKWQGVYGKIYSVEEAERIAYAIAKSRGMQI